MCDILYPFQGTAFLECKIQIDQIKMVITENVQVSVLVCMKQCTRRTK